MPIRCPNLLADTACPSGASQAREGNAPFQAALEDIRTLHDAFQGADAASGRAAQAYLDGSLSRQEYHVVRSRNRDSLVHQAEAFLGPSGRAADLQGALQQSNRAADLQAALAQT